MTVPRLLTLLQDLGIDISKRQIVRLLSARQDAFLAEAKEVLRAGLCSASWITADDTGARHKARNGFCTHLGNDRFAFFATTASKSRLNFLELLRAGQDGYVINEAALAYMRADPNLGQAREPPARSARPALQLGLSVRRGLPGPWRRQRSVGLPTVSIEAMNKHLIEIGKCVSAGAIALLIVDGAGWHSSPKLAVPENIVLLKLPPYAPELNPVENVWEYLRGNALSHQVWETYDAIAGACCDAWNSLTRAPDLIRSIATRKWAQVKT